MNPIALFSSSFASSDAGSLAVRKLSSMPYPQFVEGPAAALLNLSESSNLACCAVIRVRELASLRAEDAFGLENSFLSILGEFATSAGIPESFFAEASARLSSHAYRELVSRSPLVHQAHASMYL